MENRTTTNGFPQFGLQAALWTLLVIGMVMGFLRRFDSPAVFLEGTILVAMAALVGGAVGWFAGRSGDSAYWSVIITTAAFLSVVGEEAYGPVFPIAWSAVGMIAGAGCGLIRDNRPILRMVIGLFLAGATMLIFSVALVGGPTKNLFDLACAPIVGALVGLLIEIILWLEKKRFSPRYVTASWLLCAVILGNLMSRSVL